MAVLDHFRAVPVEVPDRLAPAGHHISGGQNAVRVRRRRRVDHRVQRHVQFRGPGHVQRDAAVSPVRLRQVRVPGDHHHRGTVTRATTRYPYLRMILNTFQSTCALSHYYAGIPSTIFFFKVYYSEYFAKVLVKILGEQLSPTERQPTSAFSFQNAHGKLVKQKLNVLILWIVSYKILNSVYK